MFIQDRTDCFVLPCVEWGVSVFMLEAGAVALIVVVVGVETPQGLTVACWILENRHHFPIRVRVLVWISARLNRAFPLSILDSLVFWPIDVGSSNVLLLCAENGGLQTPVLFQPAHVPPYCLEHSVLCEKQPFWG